MTPRVGVAVASVILAVASAAVAGAWTIASPERRSAFRKRVRNRSAWTGVAAGVLAWTIGLAVAGPVAGDDSEHSLSFYVGIAVVGYAAPISLAFFALARWARRRVPEEWAAVTAGELAWSRLSRQLRIAYVTTAFAMVAPGALMTMILFD